MAPSNQHAANEPAFIRADLHSIGAGQHYLHLTTMLKSGLGIALMRPARPASGR